MKSGRIVKVNCKTNDNSSQVRLIHLQAVEILDNSK